MNQTIRIDLTLDEVNAILAALGNLPYVRVFELIGKIQVQARSQVGDIAAPAVPEAKADPTK